VAVRGETEEAHRVDDARPRRGLTTARSVLHVLAFLEANPEGARADHVALVVGKSASTAYYLLASLVEEGFATHEGGLYLACDRSTRTAAVSERRHALEDAVDDLFLRTHKRCYLGVVRGGVIEITVVRGRQGIACMPGLGTQISANAHALAMGKVVLARLGADALGRYVARGLPGYTEHTITSPAALARELSAVRAQGFAVDREEFDEDFCCVAAPVLGERRELRGIIGLSASTHAFDSEHDELASAVLRTAREASPAPAEALA
jgi:acetyl-CoA synthetase